MARYLQGKYNLKNKEKYVGNSSNIKYRSSYELRIFRIMDESPEILKWSSEELIIPYFDPVKNKTRRYYTDIYCEYKNGMRYVFEIKPMNKIIKSKIKNQIQLDEYNNIMAKANATKKFCEMVTNKTGNKIKFAFIVLIKDKFQIINY